MRDLIGDIARATAFLSRLPVPERFFAGYDGRMGGLAGVFALSGLVLSLPAGLLLALLAACDASPMLAAFLTLAAQTMVTGALHEDGLADCADGFGGGRSRERILEIMKDSRIGAMGAIALVAVLLLKVAFIAAAGDNWWRAVLFATVLGRWVDLYGIFFFPAAREGGLGRNFRDFIQRRDFVFATVLMILLCVLVSVAGAPVAAWPAALLRAAITFVLALLTTHMLCRRWTHALGGLTGDIYGALCEIGETVALAAMSATLR